jgi:hypothetical protein
MSKLEEKRGAIEARIAEHWSVTDLAREHGVSNLTMTMWLLKMGLQTTRQKLGRSFSKKL